MQDGFSRWSPGPHPGLLPARFGVDYGFRGGWRGEKHPPRCQLVSMGFPPWETSPPRRRAPTGSGASPPPFFLNGRPRNRELQRDPGVRTEVPAHRVRSHCLPPPAATERRGRCRRGRGGARGGEGVLARLGEVSGVVTETRQYGGDRPRPLAEESPNTR